MAARKKTRTAKPEMTPEPTGLREWKRQVKEKWGPHGPFVLDLLLLTKSINALLGCGPERRQDPDTHAAVQRMIVRAAEGAQALGMDGTDLERLCPDTCDAVRRWASAVPYTEGYIFRVGKGGGK